MKKIIIDFDSTIADSSGCILKDIFNIDWEPEKLEWDFSPYGDKNQRAQMVSYFQTSEFWKKLKPVEGFREWIDAQYKQGIPIFVCSKRPSHGFDSLIAWCKYHDFDKYFTDYILVYKEFNKTFLMDDETITIDDKPDCFWNNGLSPNNIVFGNYKYATDFLEEHNYSDAIRVKSWKEMPIWN